MPDSTANNSHAQPGCFATTHWSVVFRAGSADESRSQEALESLCRAYWFPLYAYARRRGYSVEDAQDLTQEFFARVLSRNLFERADRSRGRFRTFLLAAMEHFLANEWDRARALKRGAGQKCVPLQLGDAETRYGIEPADTRSPEQMFEYNWALALLDEVIRKLEAEHLAEGQSDLWNALKPCIVTGASDQSNVERAAALGQSEGAFRVAVHRVRTRYRELLRAEIATTVDSSAEVEAEMHHLFRILTGK